MPDKPTLDELAASRLHISADDARGEDATTSAQPAGTRADTAAAPSAEASRGADMFSNESQGNTVPPNSNLSGGLAGLNERTKQMAAAKLPPSLQAKLEAVRTGTSLYGY